jgi:hypothetical protein
MCRPTDSTTKPGVGLSGQPECGMDVETGHSCTVEDVEPAVQGKGLARGFHSGTGIVLDRQTNRRKVMDVEKDLLRRISDLEKRLKLTQKQLDRADKLLIEIWIRGKRPAKITELYDVVSRYKKLGGK